VNEQVPAEPKPVPLEEGTQFYEVAPELFDEVTSAPKRRRWPWVIVIVLFLLGMLAAIAVVLELNARTMVADQVRAKVIELLDLPAGQAVDVQTEGIVIPQLLAGKLDVLHIRSDDVTIGALHADISTTLHDVSTSGAAVGDLGGTMRIHAEQFTPILRGAGVPFTAVRMQAGAFQLLGEVAILGVEVPVGIGMELSITDGRILLSPKTFEVASDSVDLAGFLQQLGPVGTALAGPFHVCIADRIPRGLELSELRVEGDVATLGFRVDPAIATDPALRERGSCPVG
jgi:hypothetical protein